ncbi:hypothetical protein [Methanosphaerula palustris]|uniref:Uncharacterized protein n=1 Tax=Methanosphaerula palustris (strain ATCC BAA-1556 / DSM 19958 / E1-9c) TaxID=521011 RepID=B8GFH7_METPE|nr:hypothetical protein [Methanosphaerula palustris]ACL16025.1 hypothetical protein Mpal_0656 [Methanosphaerula palustris E1-9c]
MKIGLWFRENRGAFAFAAVIMILGSFGYFALGAPAGMGGGTANGTMSKITGMTPAPVDPSVFDGITYKIAFTPDGTPKVFAHAKSNALANLSVAEGERIPDGNSMILGYTEGEMMKEEKLFAKPGDALTNFFGLDRIEIGGTFNRTGTFVDDLHFLSTHDYGNLTGEEGRVYSKLTPEKVPKLFYTLGVNETVPTKFVLAEGNMSGYSVHDLGGVDFYPIVLGANEAKMMREEGLFGTVGDEIRGFFGKNVVVVGVLETTNSSFDMMHVVPLNETQLG